jgi:hypothetical protein
MPSLKAAGKGSNALKSTAAQLKRGTRAREFMQSSTVKDDLPIARDWRSPFGIIVLSKPVWIDAYRAWNPLVASRTFPAAVYVNNQDLFARV